MPPSQGDAQTARAAAESRRLVAGWHRQGRVDACSSMPAACSLLVKLAWMSRPAGWVAGVSWVVSTNEPALAVHEEPARRCRPAMPARQFIGLARRWAGRLVCVG